MQDPQRLTVTIDEAAQMLGVGRNLAYELARAGQLPSMRLGKRLVVPRAALERMIDRAGEGAPEHAA